MSGQADTRLPQERNARIRMLTAHTGIRDRYAAETYELLLISGNPRLHPLYRLRPGTLQFAKIARLRLDGRARRKELSSKHSETRFPLADPLFWRHG